MTAHLDVVHCGGGGVATHSLGQRVKCVHSQNHDWATAHSTDKPLETSYQRLLLFFWQIIYHCSLFLLRSASCRYPGRKCQWPRVRGGFRQWVGVPASWGGDRFPWKYSVGVQEFLALNRRMSLACTLSHCLPSRYMYILFTKSVNSTSVPVLVQWVLRHLQTVGMHPKAAYPYSLSGVIGVLL